MREKNSFSLNSWKIIYKLANDSLVLLSIIFVFFWILGEILSGIASFYFNFNLLIFLLLLNLLAISFIGKKINLKIENKKKPSWLVWAFFFFIFISLANSVLSLGLIWGIVVLAFIFATGYLIYENLIVE